MKRFLLGELRFPQHNNPLAGAYFTLRNQYYRTGGCVFEYPSRMVTLGFRSRFYYNGYESEERNYVQRFIKPDDRVLELGACLGVVSCLTNHLLADRSAHVVVEANPELIPTLQRNRDRNDCGFAIEHCMVGEGILHDFFIHDLIVGGSADRATPRRTQVISRTLPELMAKHGEFSVLVMDIEGGEYDFFTHYKNQLAQFRVIILEQHDFIIGVEKVDKIRKILENQRFQRTDQNGQSEVWLRN